MQILRLIIPNEVTTQNQIHSYPVRVVQITNGVIDESGDTLLVTEETQDKLSKYLQALDSVLRLDPCDLDNNLRDELNDFLEDMGYEIDHPAQTLQKNLATYIGHLLLQQVLLTGKNIRAIYQAGISSSEFRLQLVIDNLSLRRWPWEFIWDNDLRSEAVDPFFDYGFLTLSRNKTVFHSHPNEELRADRQRVEYPIRILFAASDPMYRDKASPEYELRDRIAWEKQLRQLKTVFNGEYQIVHDEEQPANPENNYGIQITVVKNISLDCLRTVLKANKDTPFHIFHYVGHGWYSNAPNIGYCLAFCGKHEVAEEVTGDEVGKLLSNHGVPLVILSGCETSQEREIVEGVTQRVALQDIQAVIGMRYRIRGIDSLNFAEYFYAGLLDGRPLDIHLNRTRNALARRFINDEYFDEFIEVVEAPEIDGFIRGIQHLCPTLWLKAANYAMVDAPEKDEDKKLVWLERLEDVIQNKLGNTTVQNFLAQSPRSLGSLWFCLLADELDPEIRLAVAGLLQRKVAEREELLATHPLIEGLSTNDDGIQEKCQASLTELGEQNEEVLGILVDEYAKIATEQNRLFSAIEAINPSVAEVATWLRDSTDAIRNIQRLYYPLASLADESQDDDSILVSLITQVSSTYENYQILNQRSTTLNQTIDKLDKQIEEEIQNISGPAISSLSGEGFGDEENQIYTYVSQREEQRKQKDEVDQKINETVRRFVEQNYQILGEIRGLLMQNRIGLENSEKWITALLNNSTSLPDQIPSVIQAQINQKIDELEDLRASIAELLIADGPLDQLIQKVQGFSSRFGPQQ